MSGPRLSARQKATLRELHRLARRLGLRVSYGKMRFAGLKLKPGQCLFKNENWVVMDRAQPFDDQVALFQQAIEGLDLDGLEIPADLIHLFRPSIPAAGAKNPEATPDLDGTGNFSRHGE